jgi:predicted Zn-dependent protease
VLDELSRERPDDPDVWYDLAEVPARSGNTIGVHQARAEYFTLVGDYDQAIEQLDYAKRRAGGNFQLASKWMRGSRSSATRRKSSRK